MAYRRSYRKTRYPRRKFSKLSIYTRTSRKAQAKQIYAISKRLSNYIRRTKPETKIAQYLSQTLIPSTATEDANGGFVKRIDWTYSDGTTLPSIIPPAGSYEGDFCRLYNLLIEGVLRFEDTDPARAPLWVRLVVVQTTRTRNEAINANDIFRRSNTAEDSDTSIGNALAVHGPLQTGVSSIGRILYDKRYTLQPGHTSSRRISINLKRLGNFRKDNHGLADQGPITEGVSQGVIYVFMATSYSVSDEEGPLSRMILNAKLAYPDN